MNDNNRDEGLAGALLIYAAALVGAGFVCVAPFYFAAAGSKQDNIGLAAYRPPEQTRLFAAGHRYEYPMARLLPAPTDPAVAAFGAALDSKTEARRRQAAQADATVRHATPDREASDGARPRNWAMTPDSPIYRLPIF